MVADTHILIELVWNRVTHCFFKIPLIQFCVLENKLFTCTVLFLFYFYNIMLRPDLLTFRVAGAVFRIAGEMRLSPAYFDNPDSPMCLQCSYGAWMSKMDSREISRQFFPLTIRYIVLHFFCLKRRHSQNNFTHDLASYNLSCGLWP